MNSIRDEAKFFDSLLTQLASHFGNACEVVLHDLTQDYNHTIVDIRNGHITNREIGGCGSNLGLEVLSGNVVDGNRFNYVTTTPDGKMLRSSTIYIENEEGKVIGALCLNLDISETIKFEGYLRQYNHFEVAQGGEYFAQDVNSLLDYLLQEAESLVGKAPEAMNKEERISFIRFLDEKGAFQITKSGNRVCEVLGISKFTLYNYLDAVRGKNGDTEKEAKDTLHKPEENKSEHTAQR